MNVTPFRNNYWRNFQIRMVEIFAHILKILTSILSFNDIWIIFLIGSNRTKFYQENLSVNVKLIVFLQRKEKSNPSYSKVFAITSNEHHILLNIIYRWLCIIIISNKQVYKIN